jgi:biotin-(acetyl-CoA carboxylase) ligase
LAHPDRPDPSEIHRRWQTALINLGQRVLVRQTETSAAPLLSGLVVGTTLTGSLILEGVDGKQQIIDAGDVEFQWQP